MNFSADEIEKFNSFAHEWWDTEGKLKTLHQINPCRVQFIQSHVDLAKQKAIDVGCGGGILSESLARDGAIVTAIDLAPQSIEVAKLHLYESNLEIDYQCIELGAFTERNEKTYDVVTCMEMLEHVPDPEYIIANCAKLLKDGGVAFFSTLNKSYKSYLLGILAAEYVLNLVPKGTHEYAKFITPADLRRMLVKNGLELIDIKGMSYNPVSQSATLSRNSDVNYMVSCRKIC